MLAHHKKVQAAIQDLQAGKMIILVDHPDRENEGDIIFPAEMITPEIVNFMIRYCSGIICLSMTEDQLDKLGLPYMVSPLENSNVNKTPFTISIEARHGITTGVSAKDRAKTILTAVDPETVAADIVKPGHVFPLRAKDGGVLERAGHTEGSIDIVKLAGFSAAAVLCEIMNEDGSMAKGPDLAKFAAQHQLKIVSIDEIIAYRCARENLIAEEASALLPIDQYGTFKITSFREAIQGDEHIVLEKEPIKSSQPCLVRIHSSCATGDIFNSKRCDCKQQLNYSLKKISQEGGILIYLNQEGRGIGIFNKIKSYHLQENGLDTVEANQALGFPPDLRKYYIAANFLRNKNITDIRLLTNNPSKVHELKMYGITSVVQETIPAFCNEHNEKYLSAKKDKLHHCIENHLLMEGVNA